MKLITLRCPSCGAELNAEEGRTVLYCSFCGGKAMLDDEAQRIKVSFEDAGQSGYAFERGRMTAQAEGADPALIATVKSLAEALPRLEQERISVAAQQDKVRTLETETAQYDSFLYRYAGIIAGVGIFLLGLMFGMAAQSVVFSLVAIAAAVAAYLLVPRYVERQREEKMAALSTARQQLSAARARVEALSATDGLELIPEVYRNRDAVSYIALVLENGRAVTIRQAINLYENHLHEEKMESMQQEQLTLQRQQSSVAAKNAAADVGTSIAAGIGIAAGASILKKLWDEFS